MFLVSTVLFKLLNTLYVKYENIKKYHTHIIDRHADVFLKYASSLGI